MYKLFVFVKGIEFSILNIKQKFKNGETILHTVSLLGKQPLSSQTAVPRLIQYHIKMPQIFDIPKKMLVGEHPIILPYSAVQRQPDILTVQNTPIYMKR